MSGRKEEIPGYYNDYSNIMARAFPQVLVVVARSGDQWNTGLSRVPACIEKPTCHYFAPPAVFGNLTFLRSTKLGEDRTEYVPGPH